MRVVSLTCSNTEIVCALGCGGLLVGVDNYSDYPAAELAGLPRVGKDLDIDVDAVAALQPDLVLASLTVPGHERVVAGVEAAGLPFLAPDPTSIRDVYRDIRSIAAHLDCVVRGEALIAAMQQALTPSVPVETPSPPRICVEWWPKPVIVPGRQSWVTEMIEIAGGCNPFGDRNETSVTVAPGEAAPIDAVVISWCGVELANYRPAQVLERAGWEQVPAVVEKRVFPISEAFLGRPGPRLVDGVAALRRVVAACRPQV
ncbi:MAG: helical backbone metal receptor [Planctomycetota bacterium]